MIPFYPIDSDRQVTQCRFCGIGQDSFIDFVPFAEASQQTVAQCRFCGIGYVSFFDFVPFPEADIKDIKADSWDWGERYYSSFSTPAHA